MQLNRRILIKRTNQVFYLTCTAIAVIQTYQMLAEYLSRPLIISSTTSNAQSVSLPSISICNHNQFGGPGLHYLISSKNYTLDINFETLYQESLKPDLITNCAIRAPDLTVKNCTDIVEPTAQVSWEYTCNTYFDTNEYAPYDTTLLKGYNFAEFHVNNSRVRDNELLLDVHPPHSYPDTLQSFSSSATINSQSIEIFTLSVTQSSYAIHAEDVITPVCLNYSLIGFFNREHCLYECTLQAYVKLYNAFPGVLFGSKTNEFEQLAVRIESLPRDLLIDCSRESCPLPDCVTTSYTVTLTGQLPRREDGSTLRIFFGPPFGTDTQMLVRLKVSFNELLSQIGGAFGLWVGASVVSGVSLMAGLVDRFAAKRWPSARVRVWYVPVSRFYNYKL